MPLYIYGRAYAAAIVQAASTTFDPANTTVGAALSNVNLTCTTSTAGSFAGTRSIASHSTGKYYVEYAVVAFTNEQLGVGISSTSLTTNTSGQAGACTYDALGRVFINSVQIGATISTWNSFSAQTVDMALDIDAKLIWFRVDNGNWNNDVSANPATGAVGKDISTISAGALFAFVQGYDGVTPTYTANFGDSAYTRTAPSGFGAF